MQHRLFNRFMDLDDTDANTLHENVYDEINKPELNPKFRGLEEPLKARQRYAMITLSFYHGKVHNKNV